MKSTIQRALIAVAVAALGAGAVGTASAQTTTAAPSSSAPQQHHGHHHFHRGGRFVGSLLQATRQLNLTAEQQTSIKSILKSVHTAHAPGTLAQQPAITVLGNPGDQGFASAVQGEASKAASRVHNESVLAGQIYGVLTPQQQSQLPAVLASIQAKQQARRAAWAAKRASSNG